VIVIDASILVNVLGDDGADGQLARQAVAGQELAAPELIDVEVASVLRRHWLAKTITARRFAAVVGDLMDLPLVRYPALPFLPRVYELRANVSADDAVYVALAEFLECALLTADRRLAAAPGPRCTFTVLA
jgi:predicted nucleic acid-binding protein